MIRNSTRYNAATVATVVLFLLAFASVNVAEGPSEPTTTFAQCPSLSQEADPVFGPSEDDLELIRLSFFVKATATSLAECLSRGTSLAVRDREGNTWLHFAGVYNSRLDFVEALLEAGADVHARNGEGHTPLHSAAYGTTDQQVIQLLLAYDADVNTGGGRPPFSGTPLHLSGTPLHLAAHSNGALIVQALISGGADIEATTSAYCGRTPLFPAAARNVSATQTLVDSGASVNARDCLGETPLHSAATSADPRLIRILIAAGADVDARSHSYERTPLHVAAQNSKDPTVIDALLDAGADPSARTTSGETALSLALNNYYFDAKESAAYWRLHEAQYR